MKKLKPYIIFQGKCEEALTFYKECLNGEITIMQTFEDSPLDMPEEYKQKIFNAEFQADDICFGASDSVPAYEIPIGKNFALFINFSEDEEIEKVFAKLSEGGTIIMPLEVSSSGTRFGMLADKYGIQWMLACHK